MLEYTVYTDGSFGDEKIVHGGIVYWNGGDKSCVHVKSENEHFVSMRNVGGEILAAWAAIMSICSTVKEANEKGMETYKLKLVYDYKGIGEWLKGSWKTNVLATQWFVSSVRKMLSEVPNLTVEYVWVKGHSGDRGNHTADLVANYNMAYCNTNNIPVCNLDEIIKL